MTSPPAREPDTYRGRVPPLAPFASALAAYAAGDPDPGLRLRSSLGEDEALPTGFFFRDPDRWMDFERYAVELCRGRVLDLGAGVGPHTLALQALGHSVVAVEGSAGIARLLRERGARSVVHADFRLWWRPGFDTVVMLMNGLGPVGTLAGLDRFLIHARRFLAPGGQLLVDGAEAVMSRPSVPASWPPAGEYPGEAWVELSHAGRIGRPFRELYIDIETLASHAVRAGWQLEPAFDGGDGTYLARLTKAS